MWCAANADLACKEPVTRNRHRRSYPFESAVPGFAEYLRRERGFKEITIRNYRRHLSEFAEYLTRVGVTSFSELSPALLAAFVIERTPKMGPRTRRDLCGHRPREYPALHVHRALCLAPSGTIFWRIEVDREGPILRRAMDIWIRSCGSRSVSRGARFRIAQRCQCGRCVATYWPIRSGNARI